MIPLRQWAQQWWQRDPTHVLTAADVVYRAPSGTRPDGSPDLGASGPFLNWIMETHVGVSSVSGQTIRFNTPIGPIYVPIPIGGGSGGDPVRYLQTVRARLAASLRPFVGKNIAQLPASLAVPIAAPAAPEGLIPIVPDPGTIINNLIDFAGLGPVLVGAIILVAILALIYAGVKRTLL